MKISLVPLVGLLVDLDDERDERYRWSHLAWQFVRTRFLEKFDSWSWTNVGLVFLLIWWDVVRSLEFDPLILSRLDVYAWFGGSEARDVLEVCWMCTLDLGKRSMRCSSSWLNAYSWFEEAKHVMFLKLEFWKKVCLFKRATIFEGSWSLGRNLVSSKKLR